MSRARLFVACLALVLWSGAASAQRGNDFDALLAQMNAATQGGRWAEGLAVAQKLETLVKMHLTVLVPQGQVNSKKY